MVACALRPCWEVCVLGRLEQQMTTRSLCQASKEVVVVAVRGETRGVGAEGVEAVGVQLLLTLQLMLSQQVGLASCLVCTCNPLTQCFYG